MMAETGVREPEATVPIPATTKRVKERRQYTEDCLQDDEIEGKRMFSVDDKLTSSRFGFFFVKEMTGEEFNLKHLQQCGFEHPVIIKDKTGLGMRMPSSNFTVNDVKQCVGSRRLLDVMDVTTQKDIEMSMKDWCRYFESTNRDKLLNVISLEFSHTKLENYVESPAVVRQVDWVDLVWPRHLKESQIEGTNAIEEMKYPKVQKYCLMSVKGCYTDFHVDFGGTSVWYHIMRGSKVFWLIPPTESNIQLYEQWVLSGKQGDIFFGDTVEKCARVHLLAGYTFFIPTGWIHAVYTPEDSLVFGGNFLHSFGMEKQIRIIGVEDVTHVPLKFRYPFYTEIMWYALQRYIYCHMGKNHLTVNENGDTITTTDSLPDKENRISINHCTEEAKDLSCEKDHSLNGFRAAAPLPTQTPQLQVGSKPELGVERSDVPQGPSLKPKTNLPKFEVNGLKVMLEWLRQLPSNKRSVPELVRDPDALIADGKILIEEHENDDEGLAATGTPTLFWTMTPKKRPKPRPNGPSGGGSKSGSKSGGKSGSGSNNNNSARRRRTRCKKCEACLRADCGDCHFCKDMKKFGGPGRMKQSCISRQCMAPVLPHTACCMLCGRDGWEKVNNPQENEISSLMECSQCWEIVHPACLKDHNPDLPLEGMASDDLPNSWECPRCVRDGKPETVKPRYTKPVKVPSTPVVVAPATLGHSLQPQLQVLPSTELVPPPPVSAPASVPPPAAHLASSVVPPCSMALTPGVCDLSITTPTNKSILSVSDMTNVETTPRSVTEHNIKEERLSDGENRIIEPLRKKIKADGGRVIKQESPENQGSNADDEGMSSPTSSPSSKEQLLTSHLHKHHRTQKRTSESSDGEKDESGLELRARSSSHLSLSMPSRKHTETARERLFRNLKGLKKNSELARHSILRVKTKALSDSSNSCSLLTRKDGPLTLKSLNSIKIEKPNTEHKKVRGSLFISDSQDDIKQNLSSDKSDKQENKCDSGQQLPSPDHRFNMTLRDKSNLRKPKYVVRPAPILDDPKLDKQRAPGMPINLALEKDVLLPVFHFLTPQDLLQCQLVCKTWNRWCVDPRLWTYMDLSRKKICVNVLMGIVRRQPVTLNLSWTNISKRQLAWLIHRLPQLKDLVLSGCASAAVSALCSSGCPLLRSLDLCWTEGLVDSIIRDLLSPPSDSRPGFVEAKTRLRQLMEVRVAGADISDVSVRLLAHHLPLLSRLDLSHCHKVTDMGIAVLGAAKAVRLTHLDVSSCSNISDTSLEALKRCSNLMLLDMRECPQVAESACQKFVSHLRYSMTIKEGKFMERKH